MDPRKRQTSTAAAAKPGQLPNWLDPRVWSRGAPAAPFATDLKNKVRAERSETTEPIFAFAGFLASKGLCDPSWSTNASPPTPVNSKSPLRQLWESLELSADEFADEVAVFFGLRRLTLADLEKLQPLTGQFAPRFLRETGIFPFAAADGRPTLAVGDPADREMLKAAEIMFGEAFEVVVASFEDIRAVLGERLAAEDAAMTGVTERKSAGAAEDIDNLRDLASGAPVVRAVNDLMEKAVELGASDIHIEPSRDGLAVRLRVDGLLRTTPAPTHVLPRALISRIKILAGLNIAERRLPQDGAARVRVARTELDIRVATMPSQHGESAVIRLLPRDRGLLEISKLGLSPRDEESLRRLIDLPHGMMVVTGPTGSGKTTTLATMLSALNSPSRKILTVEDPVEYEIAGINQSQVNPAIGLTFATAMRAFVRQDPDVIMVGEIRDAETAKVAVHAALTGHLVLTTLHTETSAAAVPRLIDLGVEPFLLKSTLRAVVAQRLVRLLCERCKTRHVLTLADLDADPRLSALGFEVGQTVHRPRGCERCGGVGYRGRVGVFEVLDMTSELRALIGSNPDSGSLDAAAREAGMRTMIDDAIDKCRHGVTSISEALRVTTIR